MADRQAEAQASEFDEFAQKLLLAEEEKSEKFANYWRLGISAFFFLVTKMVAKEIPHSSVVVLVAGSTLYFAFSVFMLFLLRRGGYTPRIKYISVCFDIIMTTVCMWAFGTYRTFKTEAFLLYYIWIALATMRLSERLTLFAGVLSIACYITLVVLALARGSIETGSISESFISPKVSLLNQVLRVLYMSIVVISVTYGAKAYRRLARMVHERELEAGIDRIKAQKLESIGFLAGGIAHDFNNALATITNSLFLAKREKDLGDRAVKRLEIAEAAAIKATHLTRQLLTFSKGGTPVRKVTPARSLCEDACRFSCTGTSVRCEQKFDGDLPAVEVDEGQIAQVLSNILINATQSSPAGGLITLSASRFNVDHRSSALPLEPGQYVRISISDRGAGISPEDIEKIFDPYFTTKEKGSGLGLAIAYSIIKRHHGHIAVESSPGAGATFHIFLPASAKPIPDAPIFNSTGSMAKGLRILVMDDEPALLDSIAEALRANGHMVSLSSDGASALELFGASVREGRPFDVLVLDLTIPGGMGGREALRRMSAIAPGIKAVAISGYSEDSVTADPGSHGFASFVAKPFRMEDLMSAIAAASASRGC